MTDQERKVMEMALETLERASDAGYSIECEEAIEALRQALAQPDRECDLNKCRNRVREASDFAGLAGAPSYRR